ncbi:MAG: PEGA domain-containing protein, partial [Vicinamibacterales bacterium]
MTFRKAPESALDGFPSERRGSTRPIWIAVAVLLGAALISAALALWPRWRPAPVPQVGQLAVVSDPAGADVIIDGQRRGIAPLTLSLPAGTHALQLTRDAVTRNFSVTIKPGAEVMHHVDLEARPAIPDVGQLQVTSDPSGARVTVDGQPRGVTPASIADIAAGQHTVLIHGDSGTVQRLVIIQRGETASLVVSTNQAAFGWVSIASPVVMQILEDDRRLGTTETARITMPAGRHTLKIANTQLGYLRSQVVQVPAGGAANITIDLPDGVVNLNALPWA